MADKERYGETEELSRDSDALDPSEGVPAPKEEGAAEGSAVPEEESALADGAIPEGSVPEAVGTDTEMEPSLPQEESAAPQEGEAPLPEGELSQPPEAEEAPALEETEEAGSRISGIRLAEGICQALLAAGGQERFHGGVRPDNVTVQDGQVYLGPRLKHGVGEFTPLELEYMAPELFWDGIRSPAADVYSVGLVLYSVYNYGRLPFWPSTGAVTPNIRAGALQRRMSGDDVPPPAAGGRELREIILRALSFRTEERWQDARELLDALGSCEEEEEPADISLVLTGEVERRTGVPEPAAMRKPSLISDTETDEEFSRRTSRRRPSRRRGPSWAWVVVLVVLIAGALVLLLRDQGQRSPGLVNGTPDAVISNIPTATPVITATPTMEATDTPEPTAVPEGPRFVAYREDVSWSEAQARCEELGGRLAMPITQDELEEIIQVCEQAGLQKVWLGAHRQEDDSWISTSGDMVMFFFWGDNEPSFVDAGDGAAEDYMMLWYYDGQWSGNDSREDPLEDYYWAYAGQIGFVCQMY